MRPPPAAPEVDTVAPVSTLTWPEPASVHAWPAAFVAMSSEDDMLGRLPAGSLRLTRARKRRQLRLSVDRPLVALQYAVAWQLP